MVKCDICNEKIAQTFLNKILGTYQKDSKGKKKAICQSCQKEYSKEELKEKIEE